MLGFWINYVKQCLKLIEIIRLIESEIGREKPQTVYRSDSQKFDESFFTRYQSYDEVVKLFYRDNLKLSGICLKIVDFLESISTTHSEFVELSTLGKSFEGRNIPYVKVLSEDL